MRYRNSSSLFSAPKTGIVVNDSGWVCVREAASPNSKIVGFTKPGDSVKIKQNVGNYILAEFNGGQLVGYIASSFVKVNNYISAAPPVTEEENNEQRDS